MVKGFFEITNDEIVAFVKAKFDNAGCPVCGTNDWIRETPDSGTLPVISTVSSKGPGNDQFPIFILTCMNCGWLSCHMVGVVRRWLAEAETAGKTDG